MRLVLLRYVVAVVSLIVLTGCGGGGDQYVPDDTGNVAPVARSMDITTYEQTVYSGTLVAVDKDNRYIKYYLVKPPRHGKVTIDEVSGYFTYTPDSNFVGEDLFYYRAFDGLAYSLEAPVTIQVISPISNVSDKTPPSAPVLVNVTAPSTDNIALYWLAAQDDQTAADKMRHEIHVSKQPLFTPDAATRKMTVTGSLEAIVDSLEEKTAYYVKIVAVDDADHRAVSNELNITTASASDIVISQPDKIKRADDLFLHDAVEISEDKIVYPKTDQMQLPEEGDIFFGDKEERVLRKVIRVSEENDRVVLYTQKASLNEVVEKATIETSTLLVDQEALSAQHDIPMMRSLTRISSGEREDIYGWQSGRFEIASLNEANTTVISGKTVQSRASAIDNDDNLYITVKQDRLIAYEGRLNFVDVEVEQTDQTIKIDKFHIKEVEHDGEEIACDDGNMRCGVFRLDNINWGNNFITGQLLVDRPDKSMVSDKPYKVTLYAESEDTGLNDKVEVTPDVYIVSDNLDIDADKRYTFDYGIGASVEFTPTVFTKIVIDNSSITYSKVSVGGRLRLDINEELSLEAGQKFDKTFSLGSKKFTQVYMVAGVPVYQEITIGWSAQVKGSVSGAIKQTIDLTKIYDASFGVEYVNGSWRALKSTGDYSNLTANISLGAQGELEVRLIPEVTIVFYRAASAGMSIEPWGKVDFAAHGQVTTMTDFESYDAMVQYGLDRLDATVGLDVKMFVSLEVFDYNIYRWPDEGRETVVGIDPVTIFSLPTLQLAGPEDTQIVPRETIPLHAVIKPGVRNRLEAGSLEWRVFPNDGAEIVVDASDKTKGTFQFEKFENYTLVLAGYSEALGETYGRQYITIQVDARDLDGDGIADVWERANGLNPNDGTDGAADFDGDGYSNVREYQSRTDLHDPSSHPSTEPDMDTVPPVITLLGDNPMSVALGGTFIDPGAIATDNVDGNITDRIVVGGSVDTSTAGEYELVYRVADSAGNEATVARVVKVAADTTGDTTPPQITLLGDNPAVLAAGEIYTDAGAVAVDDRDGDVEVRAVSNDVNTTVPGLYHVVYEAVDSAGNRATATRDVRVVASSVLDALNDKVVAWSDELRSTYDENKTYSYRFMLALYEDKSCSLVGLNLDIDEQNADKAAQYEGTDRIYTPDEAVVPLLPCSWTFDGERLTLEVTSEFSELNTTLPAGTIGEGESWGICESGECVVERVYDVSYWGSDNISDRTVTTWSESGAILHWEFGVDRHVAIYTEGNATAQIEGTWDLTAGGSLDIYDTAGNLILRTPMGSGYKTGKYLDFTYEKGYIYDIGTLAAPPSAATRLKKTGQTKSYDSGGNEVTDGSLRDDGYYQAGVDPSYTRDDAVGIVVDHVTGLMWQDDAPVQKPWLTQENYDKCVGQNGQTQDVNACYDTSGDTAATYCEELTLGGYSDWRLPEAKELDSIVDYGRSDPAVDPIFQHTESSSYWSSTNLADYTGSAWHVDFHGYRIYGDKFNAYYVRCVRSGQP